MIINTGAVRYGTSRYKIRTGMTAKEKYDKALKDDEEYYKKKPNETGVKRIKAKCDRINTRWIR